MPIAIMNEAQTKRGKPDKVAVAAAADDDDDALWKSTPKRKTNIHLRPFKMECWKT